MNRPPDPLHPFSRWLASLPLNLRGKLMLSHMLIVFVAITGMGFYVYYRAQEANRYLSAQLEQSVQKKAEETLVRTINERATELGFFFHSRSEDTTLVAETTSSFLREESIFNSGTYWDASQALIQLPNGSWDNTNSEASSIFIPAAHELTSRLVSELNAIKHIETTVPFVLEESPEVIAIYFGGLSGETIYFPNIDLANIVPPDFDVTQRPWFVKAAPEQNTAREVVWSEPYQDAALNGLVVTSSIPVFDARDRFRGVAAMDFQLNSITEIVAQIKVGESGYAFLIDKDNRLIAFPQAGHKDFGTTTETLLLGEPINQQNLTNASEQFFGILAEAAKGNDGITTINLGGTERYMVYRNIPEVGYSLVMLVPVQEMLVESQTANQQIAQATRNTLLVSFLLVVAILLAASVGSLALGNALTAPLKALTETAEKIAGGSLETRAEIQSQDEIGLLSRTLDTMTSAVSGFIQTLEQRVAQRTADLETARALSERRVHDLQAIGDIARVVASEQKLDNLLPLITNLVSEQFGFYHVGIFLNDESNQFAVLQAANSAGGKKMLARGHKLEIGETGIVGYVAKHGDSRIALDVGTDAAFFNNPDLPATRSEMALPLNSRGRIIGVLDVQSEKPGVFTVNDAKTLAILADQIAIAIENAHLLEETQRALTEAQSLYSQYVRESWGSLAQSNAAIGYHQSMAGGRKLTEPVDSEEIREVLDRGQMAVLHGDEANQEPAIIVPVKLRGQVIGALNIKAPSKDHYWSQDEINLAEAVSDRLSLALENARLFEETNRRAERERLVSDITTRIRGTNDPQDMIRTALQELQRALGATRVEIIPQKSPLPPGQ